MAQYLNRRFSESQLECPLVGNIRQECSEPKTFGHRF